MLPRHLLAMSTLQAGDSFTPCSQRETNSETYRLVGAAATVVAGSNTSAYRGANKPRAAIRQDLFNRGQLIVIALPLAAWRHANSITSTFLPQMLRKQAVWYEKSRSWLSPTPIIQTSQCISGRNVFSSLAASVGLGKSPSVPKRRLDLTLRPSSSKARVFTWATPSTSTSTPLHGSGSAPPWTVAEWPWSP